ncbi:MAG: hypothetical protein AB1705_02235 [Verrucomicrobiota bacterium]
MFDSLKSAARKGVRKFARWVFNEKNLPRVRVARSYARAMLGEDNEIAEIRSKHLDLIRDLDKRARLRTEERQIFSQFGEDGLILYFLSRIGAPHKNFIEFGIEDGVECNAANVAINFGWAGLFLEGSPSLAERAREFYHRRHRIAPDHVRIESHFLTRENVNDIFAKYGYTGEIDLLSLDIDGNDYWLWEAIQVVTPRLVVIEYNATFGAERAVTVPYEAAFQREAKHPSGWYHGASLRALNKLAKRKGYFLGGCDSSGANAFFVREDVGRGKVEELTVEEAFYPCAPRLRSMSQERQFEVVKNLPLVEV